MSTISNIQKDLLQAAQKEVVMANEKLDIIVTLIADAHNVKIPFAIDEKTGEVYNPEMNNVVVDN